MEPPRRRSRRSLQYGPAFDKRPRGTRVTTLKRLDQARRATTIATGRLRAKLDPSQAQLGSGLPGPQLDLEGGELGLGIVPLQNAIQAPNANAHAERVIETMRAECLDWMLILGQRHLDRTLRTYADHYNRGRSRCALALASPLAEASITVPVPVSTRDVRRRDLLGGLIHEYHGAAA